MFNKLAGNLLVGQSGGPTAVINSTLCGVIHEAMKYPEIKGIYGAIHGIQGVLEEDIIDIRREKISTIEGLKQTPSAALGSCRHKLKETDYEKILAILKAHNIRYFLYIGGNDSADTSYKIEKVAMAEGYELRVVGIPKTVDNDLALTDHCPGYGSVARFIAIATMDAGRDTDAIGVVDTVKIIETMGRNAGWITASSILGKKSDIDAPHLVYVPERAVILDKLLGDVDNIYRKLNHVVMVVCEGVRGEKGEPLVATGGALYSDAFGHKQLGGVSDFLCKLIADKLKIKARYDKPGTIQRMCISLASKTDLKEAYLAGKMGVRYAIKGISGKMVILIREPGIKYKCKTGLADLEEIANREKLLPPGFINEEGNSITDRYREYALPLIGDPLPDYVRLEGHRIPRIVK